MTRDDFGDTLPTPKEILATHEEIERAYDMKYTGVRVAAPKLKLKRIIREADDYDDLYHRAAYLLRKLVTAHLFEDGNKRTAWVTVRKYLAENGETPAKRDSNAGRVLRRIRRYDVAELAEWLESGEIDESRLGP